MKPNKLTSVLIFMLVFVGGSIVVWNNTPLLRGRDAAASRALTGAEAASATVTTQMGRGLAPDFTLSSLQGEEIRLSEMRGQVVLVNFWATWCPPCRFEMPAMQEVYETYRKRGFVILAVNFKEDEAQVRSFVDEFRLTFPVLLDKSGNVAAQYRVVGLPSSYFVDAKGRVQAVRVGAMDKEYMETQVRRLLK